MKLIVEKRDVQNDIQRVNCIAEKSRSKLELTLLENYLMYKYRSLSHRHHSHVQAPQNQDAAGNHQDNQKTGEEDELEVFSP